MKPSIDPAVLRFMHLTSYFLWNLLNQPEDVVFQALRTHPKYRNARVFGTITETYLNIANEAYADAFVKILLLSNGEQNLDSAIRIVRESLIAAALANGELQRAEEFKGNHPVANEQVSIYTKKVYEAFLRFAVWVPKIMPELPALYQSSISGSDKSDFLNMKENFWPIAKSVSLKLPDFLDFFLREYHAFLTKATEAYLNLIIIQEPGIVSRKDVGLIVNQLYVMGITKLRKLLA